MAAVGSARQGTIVSGAMVRLRSLTFNEVGLPVALVAAVVIFAAIQPRFIELDNWFNIGRQGSVYAVLAFGMGLTLLMGGLDLAIGSTLSLAAVVAALGAKALGTPAGFALGILAGLGVGLVNGALIAGIGISPFIATLGMLSGVAGLALLLSGGLPVSDVPDGFGVLGTETVWGLPLQVLVVVVILVVLYGVLRFTRFGRHTYALGGNERALWLAGVNVRRHKTAIYGISGTLGGTAGILLASRVSSGVPTLGLGAELQTIAIVLIGGVSVDGGRGSIVRIAAAALFLAIVNNGLNLVDVQSYWQQVLTGVFIALAATADVTQGRLGSVRRWARGATTASVDPGDRR